MEKREYCIRFIRSRLPYMGEKELDFLLGFTRGICRDSAGTIISKAEYLRPVLSETGQRNADSAYSLMETVRDSLSGRNGSTACCIAEEGKAQEPGVKVIGERRGELAVMDFPAMMELFSAEGLTRVKRSDMLDGMETAGFILPRDRNPRTATIGGKRREVVYVPMDLLQESEPCKEVGDNA